METGAVGLRRRLKLPFRVGTTSYVWPEDIISNVRRLKGLIDDVELVLFESEQSGNIPAEEEMDELRNIGAGCDMSYTVHLPLDLNLGSSLAEERAKSISCIRSISQQVCALAPKAYILHLNLPESSPRDIPAWQEYAGISLKEIAAGNIIAPVKVAVENLSYPFDYIGGQVLESGFSVCADIGHLLVMGLDPLAHLEKYFESIAVIHLHGVNGAKDHVSLKYLNQGMLKDIADFLMRRGYAGVLTLEVFAQSDFEESMEILWESLYL